MRHKKTITCISYDPVARYPRYATPWDDVWVHLWIRRRRVCLGPCVMGLAHARQRLEIALEVEAAGAREDVEPGSPYAPWGSAWWKSAISRLESGHERVIVFKPEGIDDCPNVIMAKDYLTRPDIEEALRFYLLSYLKGGEARFRWKKPRLFIQSV